jgi:hypothetical protein
MSIAGGLAARRVLADRRTSNTRRGASALMALTICLTLSMAACGAAGTQSPPTGASGSGQAAGPADSMGPGATGTVPASAAPTMETTASMPVATTVPTPVPSGTIEVHGATTTFTSVRYGYSVQVGTADWIVSETPGTWDGVLKLNDFAPESGTDWLKEPGIATVQIGVLAVPPGTTASAWESSEAPSVRKLACTEAASTQTVTISGLRVLLLPETCPKTVVGEFPGDQYFLNAFFVHGATGVIAQWRSEQGHAAADRATFLRILGTMKWAKA